MAEKRGPQLAHKNVAPRKGKEQGNQVRHRGLRLPCIYAAEKRGLAVGLAVSAALKDVLKADEDIDEAPCRVAAELLESLVEEEHGQRCVDYACQAATEPPQQANYTSLPRIPPSPRAREETRHESHEAGQGPPHAIAHAYPLIKAP